MPRKTNDERLESVAAAVFEFGALLLINFLNTWFVMLALGAVHGQWPAIPAFGYWTTFIILAGLGAVSGTIRGGMKVKTKS